MDLANQSKEKQEEKKYRCRVILGIDNMKFINIEHGREKGDHVLRKMEQIISKFSGEQDAPSRISGDCFSFCLEETIWEKVQEVYRKISNEMKEDCTFSGGAVFYDDGFEEKNEYEIMDCAMFAMDQAKKQGKNKLVFYSESDYMKWLESARMEENILNDITNDCRGFSVVYQPQIFAGDYNLYGAEVLMRYTLKNGQPVSPAEFIPILERNRTICVVGQWVLKTALRQCKEWRERYMPDFHVSVNLSYVQLENMEIVEIVREALRENDLPGSALTLEITETGKLYESKYIEEMIREWHADGISLSLDDFGTGYSNFERMSKLAFDEIKVDKSLVNMEEIHKSFLKDVIRSSNARNTQVCCEGVETRENLFLMERLDPKIFQGFLFSRPRWSEDFEEAYFIPGTDSYKERVRNNDQLVEYIRSKERDERKNGVFQSEQVRELFHMVMSETMAYAVVDLDNGMISVYGDSWKRENGEDDISFEEEFHRFADIERSLAREEDRKLLEGLFGEDCLGELVKKKNYRKKIHYRRQIAEKCEWVELGFFTFEGTETKTRYLLCWLKNVNEAKKLERELREKAMRDSLTKTYTMEAFRNCVEDTMRLAENDGKGTLIMFDIDNFKSINDQYGHQTGDVILKEVADVMRKTFRKDDIIGRLGGDEFAVFIPELTDRKTLNERMDALYAAFQKKKDIHVSLSAGIVNVYSDDFNFSKCRNMADMALYASKRGGKNQYQYSAEK